MDMVRVYCLYVHTYVTYAQVKWTQWNCIPGNIDNPEALQSIGRRTKTCIASGFTYRCFNQVSKLQPVMQSLDNYAFQTSNEMSYDLYCLVYGIVPSQTIHGTESGRVGNVKGQFFGHLFD